MMSAKIPTKTISEGWTRDEHGNILISNEMCLEAKDQGIEGDEVHEFYEKRGFNPKKLTLV